MAKCLCRAPLHVHAADCIFLFLTLRELSPHLSGRPDQSTGLIGGSLTWNKILAQEICIGVYFWDSGEHFVDVDYKPMTTPGFTVKYIYE